MIKKTLKIIWKAEFTEMADFQVSENTEYDDDGIPLYVKDYVVSEIERMLNYKNFDIEYTIIEDDEK